MLTRQVALVSETPSVGVAELMRVAAALQIQATRDVAPIWHCSANVSAFAVLEDVPTGYWPIVVVEAPGHLEGFNVDAQGTPYALVQFGPGWALRASHECTELLVDPYGHETRPGQSPKPDQGYVDFLVELCGPCAGRESAYEINGVSVSDFCTPDYFLRDSSARYSYTGAVTRPGEVLRGGYLGWRNSLSNDWWQKRWFAGSGPAIFRLGRFARTRNRSTVRGWIDASVPERREFTEGHCGGKDVANRQALGMTAVVGMARAAAFRGSMLAR